MHEEVIWQARFGGRFLDRDHAIAVYRIHVQQVRDTVPADRLLELEVGQGWEPLCRFLDCPAPAEPYPRLNDRHLFRRIVRALRVAQWAVPLVVAVGVVAAVLWAM
jgi:hypothetical protein